MLRTLSGAEIATISGGVEDYGFGDYGDGSFSDNEGFSDGGSGGGGEDHGNTVYQDVPSPTDMNGDIVVTATREEGQDAQASYQAAVVVVNTLEYGGMAAAAVAGGLEIGGVAKIVEGIAGGSVTLAVSDHKQELTNSIANTLYANMREGAYNNPMLFQP